jgi:mannosyl-oligosaccharide glucosidase
VIKDSLNNVKLTTEFLKIAGGDHGGSWAARIKGEPIDPCLSKPPIPSDIRLTAG